jgi:nucleoside phosphorylase
VPGNKVLVLFGALEEEISGFRSSMIVTEIDIGHSGKIYSGSYKGKSLLLVNHGVGKRRVISSCRWVLDHYPVSSIVSLGFAGALKPGSHTGDMYICSSMVCTDEPVHNRQDADPYLFAIARTCKLPGLTCGIGATAGLLISTPLEKYNLRESTSADIVDMESYWLACIARDHGIPLVVGRAISDTEKDIFPILPSYKWYKAVTYLFRHPVQGWRFFRGMSRARASLTVFAAHMVESLA